MGDDRIQRIVMPKWGATMTQGTILEWFVSEGDTVDIGMDLVEIEIDKTTGTLESPAVGLLRRIIAEPETDVPVNGTLAIVAPADVPDVEIDEEVAKARAELERLTSE